jgi:hypothetical protein
LFSSVFFRVFSSVNSRLPAMYLFIGSYCLEKRSLKNKDRKSDALQRRWFCLLRHSLPFLFKLKRSEGQKPAHLPSLSPSYLELVREKTFSSCWNGENWPICWNCGFVSSVEENTATGMKKDVSCVGHCQNSTLPNSTIRTIVEVLHRTRTLVDYTISLSLIITSWLTPSYHTFLKSPSTGLASEAITWHLRKAIITPKRHQALTERMLRM